MTGGDEIMTKISNKELEKAREMDLLTYFMIFEPEELIRISNNNYTIREHQSLKISNGKWMWWSHGFGGRSALDFLIKVRDVPFREAVTIIIEPKEYKAPIFYVPKQTKAEKKLQLPERNLTDHKVISYLRSRGIDTELIKACINSGMLYEDVYHNCVFVGFDENGKPRYASTRATNGKSDDKREASGSDKRYSFRIMHPSDTLHVFEGAIDLLSYMTLTKITDGKWTREAMVSLGGVASSKGQSDSPKVPIALQSAIENMKNLKRIVLHLDRDDAGRLAAKEIMSALQDRFEMLDQPPKYGKDMNDYLIMRGALNDKRLE